MNFTKTQLDNLQTETEMFEEEKNDLLELGWNNLSNHISNEEIEDAADSYICELEDQTDESPDFRLYTTDRNCIEKIMTDELMDRQGMSVHTEMRENNKNSYFFPICYDDAIIGVNPMTESIIYDYMRIGRLRVMFVEWTYPDYADTLYGGERMVQWIEELSNEESEGKVPPTLCLKEVHLDYWDDIKNKGW